VIFVSQWLANPAARLGREIRVSDRHRQLRVLASSSVRSPDTAENWRKIGPIAARRGKSFAGRSIMFESTRLLPTWGDNPKIRSYIEIVEFV
jgi:hypothetical protein